MINKSKRRINNELKSLKIKISKVFRRLYSQQHQLTSTTSENRYPVLFEETKKNLNRFDESTLKILSFGCSTGEECFSLRSYFPASSIIGIDINSRNISKARKRSKDSGIVFSLGTEIESLAQGPYHAIFCLSVLCRWEDTKDKENCEAIYPFEKFQSTITQLSEALIPEGLLIIYNCNFRFEDTEVFSRYEIVPTSLQISGFVTKFDANNNRINDAHANCIYRKVR